jgi:molybdenum cofactor biosynthesis enzyme MoaA
MMSDKRCSLLWNHVRIHVDNKVLPCCMWSSDIGYKGHQIPDIADGIDAAFNSELFNSLREDMEAGIEPEPCGVCYDNERNFDGTSLRTEFNKHYKFDSKKIRYIETALSTHCNLACRMCNETFSSKWFQFKNPKTKVEVETNSSILDNYDSELTELNLIKFVGGEPMIDKNHVPFLEKLFDKSEHPISLHYHTNGTVKPPEKVIDFWKQANTVKIDFSIDGVGRVNEILRPPHSWDTVLETIEYFKSIDKANIEIGIHTVISRGNIKHLGELIFFSNQLTGKMPQIDFVTYPQHLSLYNMVEEDADEISEYMKQNYLGMGMDDTIIQVIDSFYNDNEKKFSKQNVIDIENKHHYFKNSIAELL